MSSPSAPPNSAAPEVACVLVNWNNWQDTAACLASLAAQDYSHLHVFVVDNASTNDSLARLRDLHPWATYIESSSNLGFPKACNLGARHPLAAGSAFLWLLNNDTLVPRDTLQKLVASARAHPRAGIVGGVLFYMHNPKQVQAWGGGVISLWSGFNRHYTQATPFQHHSYITFASALIRREVFDQLNGLSEEVFLYFEDSDFCLRAQAAGWQLAVAPDTAILHREGGSVEERNPLLERISTTSGLVFLRRHAPVPLISGGLFVASRLAKRLALGRWRSTQAVLLGLSDFLNHRSTPFL